MNFQIVERPALYPGVSLFQLLSPRGFVDTGVEMPVGGRVYLEEVAVNEAAVLFGMVSRNEAEVLRAQVAEKDARIASLEERVAELDPIVRAVREIGEFPRVAA